MALRCTKGKSLEVQRGKENVRGLKLEHLGVDVARGDDVLLVLDRDLEDLRVEGPGDERDDNVVGGHERVQLVLVGADVELDGGRVAAALGEGLGVLERRRGCAHTPAVRKRMGDRPRGKEWGIERPRGKKRTDGQVVLVTAEDVVGAGAGDVATAQQQDLPVVCVCVCVEGGRRRKRVHSTKGERPGLRTWLWPFYQVQTLKWT